MANAAIYLPYADVDLGDAIEGGTVVRDAAGRITRFDGTVGGEPVRFNVMPAAELVRHLTGFAGYVDRLDEPDQRKTDARVLITHTKAVLGMVAGGEFQQNPALWQCLFQIAGKWDGFVFVYNSVLLPNGGVIVGPLRKDAELSVAADSASSASRDS